MSQIRVLGHSIPRHVSRLRALRWLANFAEFCLHPIRSWSYSRSPARPTADDLRRCTPDQTDVVWFDLIVDLRDPPDWFLQPTGTWAEQLLGHGPTS